MLDTLCNNVEMLDTLYENVDDFSRAITKLIAEIESMGSLLRLDKPGGITCIATCVLQGDKKDKAGDNPGICTFFAQLHKKSLGS